MIKKALRNPYFIFLPFLCYYVYFIVANKWPSLYGDEIRYVDFAHNIIHGFYSPPMPHINLWNGPGYPLVLLPFIALKIPVLYITLLNALYQYLAVVFLYKAIKLLANAKIALIACLLLAVYPNALAVLPILYTEAFTSLLVSALIYAITLSYSKRKIKYGLLAGFLLGYLTLTKVIFGYVLIIGLLICLVSLLFKSNRANLVLSLKILLVAFAVTMPYLAYTWHLTGKAFYWGDSGGMSLYWMSTPYDHEYGDWKLPNLSNNQYPELYKSVETVAILKKNHSKEVNAILKHNELEQDALFKQAAMANVKKHPAKFAQNYYYNWSRMLFNFPYSYSYQDGAIVGNIIRGSLILWAIVIGAVLTFVNRRRLIYPVKFMLLITAVYLLLSGALSAYPRQLDVTVPALLFWLGFVAANMPKLSLKFTEEDNLDDITLNDLKGINVHTQDSFKNDAL